MSIDWSAMDYIGFAYSALVAGGGIMGYVKAQSVPSLAAGLTFGAILAGGAYLNSSDPPRPLLQLTTALLLGSLMGYRFYNSGKVMPAGLVCAVSIGVLVRGLFVYNKHLPMIGSKTE